MPQIRSVLEKTTMKDQEEPGLSFLHISSDVHHKRHKRDRKVHRKRLAREASSQARGPSPVKDTKSVKELSQKRSPQRIAFHARIGVSCCKSRDTSTNKSHPEREGISEVTRTEGRTKARSPTVEPVFQTRSLVERAESAMDCHELDQQLIQIVSEFL